VPVDVSSALDLRLNHGLSYSQIGTLQQVSPQAIHQKIKDLLPIEGIKTYQENRADILSSLQVKLLGELDDDRIQKMSGKDLVVSAAVLFDKERLERDLSTDNVSALLVGLKSIKEKRTQEDDDLE